MVNTKELRGIFAKNGVSQSEVAKMLGITPKTFYIRMKKGVFGSDEIQKMIDEYQIEDPMGVFFCRKSNL
jgi:predicted transcriptional regulator